MINEGIDDPVALLISFLSKPFHDKSLSAVSGFDLCLLFGSWFL